MNPLELLFGKDLVRRAMKQKLAEPHPTCHFCGHRAAVNALVPRGDRLVKPTYRNGLFGLRRFLPHGLDGQPVIFGEKLCKGSGETLCVARGFDR